MLKDSKELDPTLKKWIVVIVRIIILIASAIGGDAVDVLNLVSQSL